MPTPMFKVLAQSLRLGQPPDATTAVRVLVEVVEKQQAELEELRSKLSIASSRIQYAEARLARLLEADEGQPREGGPPSIAAPHGALAESELALAENQLALASIVDGGLDELNQTLVIDRHDVARVADAEAPFPLAPVSERPRAPGIRSEGTPFHAPDPDAYSIELPSIMEPGEGDVTVTEQTSREGLAEPAQQDRDATRQMRRRREPGRE